MRRTSGIVLAIAVITPSVACDVGDITFPGLGCWGCPTDHIVVTPNSAQIVSGDSVRLTAVAYRLDDTIDPSARLIWSVDDPGVAFIRNGWLVGLLPGMAWVRVRADGFEEGAAQIAVEIAPAGIPRDLAFTSIEAGGSHTCALTAAGAAWCWGSGMHGQLGIGQLSAGRWTPTAVISSVSWRTLSLAGNASCALDAAGRASCWGDNPAGQLGTGTSDARAVPSPVQGAESYVGLDVGRTMTCALLATGRVRCWGADWGQYGNGTANTGGSPFPTDAANAQTFASLAVGAMHACGLDAGGRALCWGINGERLTGTGSDDPILTPTPVASQSTFESIVAGDAMTCALDASGAAHCWGLHVAGQWLVPTSMATEERFTSLAIGGRHTCGLTADGRALCWGANWLGQLGTSSYESSLVPQEVVGGYRFAMLTAGDSHTCGLSIDGVTWCWGDNQNGQLGDGTRRSSPLPVRVAGQ